MSFNHYHQSIEDIIKSASPAQKILWNDLFLRFGENIAVQQFCHIGLLAPFDTYIARRIYVAYEMSFGGTPAVSALVSSVSFHNELNAQFFILHASNIFWDATAAEPRYIPIWQRLTNFWFARITKSNLAYIEFKGFVITY